MLTGLMDYKNSLSKKLINQDKIDPGTFSFLESGWWGLHAALITGVFLLGYYFNKLNNQNCRGD